MKIRDPITVAVGPATPAHGPGPKDCRHSQRRRVMWRMGQHIASMRCSPLASDRRVDAFYTSVQSQ